MEKNNDQTAMYTKGSLPDRFDRWLRETLHNLIKTEVRSYIRKKTGRKEIFMEDMNHVLVDEAIYDPFVETEVEKIMIGSTAVSLTDERLAKALTRLSPKKKEVLEETVICGHPVRQAARRLNLAEQTVMNYKSEALRILKKQMETDSGENNGENAEG